MSVVGAQESAAVVNKPPSAGGPAPALTIAQHKLVRDALPVVHKFAGEICWKYDLYGRPERRHVHSGGAGDCVGYADLCTIGKLALYDSAPRFEPARNRSFSRFAAWRVFGAMMDEIIASAAGARIDREMVRAFAYFMADYRDDFDILQHDKEEMQRRLDAMCESAAALMFVAGTEQARVEAERDIVADTEETAFAIEVLGVIMADLDEDQRRLLRLLFVHGFNQDKVGALIGAARETVCRRLARLCAELKRLLKVHGVDRLPPLGEFPGSPAVLGETEEVELVRHGEFLPTEADRAADAPAPAGGNQGGKRR
jgi:RNA polymerase sigma factor (sigma-70 family)